MKTIWNFFQSLPTRRDAILLSAFAMVITFQPFYLQGQINIFEVGLYLPGINGILHGLVPYRDFFHLRGPFELYMPVWMMTIFGKNIAVLSAYFYLGTILTLVACVFLAREIFKTRFMLYLMVPVLVARTFPRVVFTYWGGMRYAWGILAIFAMIRFLKTQQYKWIYLAGFASACGLFTSVEIGVCAIAGIFAAHACSFLFKLYERTVIAKSLGVFLLGIAAVALPYVYYLWATHSLIPYVDCVRAVIVNIQETFNPHLVSVYPSNAIEALRAMTNPLSKNFRHMTPSYLYIILLVYLIARMKNRSMDKTGLAIVCLGTYGFIMYNTAFRGIWAAQFEMALQPEKILLFFLMEEAYFFLKQKRTALLVAGESSKRAVARDGRRRFLAYAITSLFVVIVISSIGYSVDRYNKRFFAFKYLMCTLTGKNVQALMPLAKIESRPLAIERAKGMTVPAEQADELEAITAFFKNNSMPQDTIFMYPELGTYSFLIDRPFLGRFPIATFSWFDDRWHGELLSDFKKVKPPFVIMPKDFPPSWREVYLGREENRKKYQEMINMIFTDYKLKTTTPFSNIYVLKYER